MEKEEVDKEEVEKVEVDKEVMIKRRRETNVDEKMIVLRVGQRRERGKGSEMLEHLLDTKNGSVLRVIQADFPDPNLTSFSGGKCPTLARTSVTNN